MRSAQELVLERLTAEHDRIREHLRVLEVALPLGPAVGAQGASEAPSGDQVGVGTAAAQAMHDLLAQHIPLEEYGLFAALEATLGRFSPTLSMRAEHEHVAELLENLLAALGRETAERGGAGAGEAAVHAHQLGQLLADHLDQEEGPVYRAARRHLSAEVWRYLALGAGP